MKKTQTTLFTAVLVGLCSFGYFNTADASRADYLAREGLVDWKGRILNTGTMWLVSNDAGVHSLNKPNHISKYSITVPDSGPHTITFMTLDNTNGCQFDFNLDNTITVTPINPVDAVAVVCAADEVTRDLTISAS